MPVAVAEFERIGRRENVTFAGGNRRDARYQASRVESKIPQPPSRVEQLYSERLRRREPMQLAGAGVDLAFETNRRDAAFSEADASVAVADELGGEMLNVGAVADPTHIAIALVADQSMSGSISEPGSRLRAHRSSVCRRRAGR